MTKSNKNNNEAKVVKNNDDLWSQLANDVEILSRSKQGIGNYIQFELLNPMTEKGMLIFERDNQEILDLVREKFPNCDTKLASVRWYKNASKKAIQRKDMKFRAKCEEAFAKRSK